MGGQSVGLVLMAHTVREAIEEGADEYDLLLGDETYKARFATDERAVETLVVAGALDPTRLLAQVDAGVRRAADGLSPELRTRLRDLATPVPSPACPGPARAEHTPALRTRHCVRRSSARCRYARSP